MLTVVHIVHTYDRIVPYVGHKRLTVVTLPPKVYSTRPSVLQKEYDWIENKLRPWVGYSATNRYLNSDSAVRYVYVRNPITGLRYHSEYIPSRYYNFYRIIRPFSSYDDYWPYYRPLSLYYNYWPVYRSYSYLDDVPVYRSLRLQRKYNTLTGLYYPYYTRWYNSYNQYFRYYRPISPYSYCYWPDYCSHCYSYYRSRYSPAFYDYYWPLWRYRFLDSWSPRRSYYWSKYMPISYNLDKLSPYYSKYLHSVFDDETRLIRAQTASLLKQIHLPLPRIRSWPITPLNRYGDVYSLPVKYSNDTYIHRLLTVAPNNKIQYATYYTEPVKKYIGQGHLSCVSYAGDKGYNRRRPLTIYEDALRNDIQLLSYYINKFREEKAQPKETQVPLSPIRPSRIFSVQKPLEDPVVQEIKDLREARAARLAKIYASEDKSASNVEDDLKAKKKKEEARLAEERAIAEEQSRKEIQAKKDEAARKAELARQEQLAAQAAAERAAELEKQAEKARQEELIKQAEIEKARQLEEERARQEEQRRLEEEAKAEEERKQLLRLEEIARQAEEEREAELARQAEELAELARQEAERAEIERKEREEEEKAKREAELAEIARQEAELAELERQEEELAELARQEKELADLASTEAESAAEATREAELPTETEENAELIVEENQNNSDPIEEVDVEEKVEIISESTANTEQSNVIEAPEQQLDGELADADAEEPNNETDDAGNEVVSSEVIDKSTAESKVLEVESISDEISAEVEE